MIAIRNDSVALFVGEDGRGLALVDARRGTRWVVDEETLTYRRRGAGDPVEQGWLPLRPLQAVLAGPRCIEVAHVAGEETVRIEYELIEDGLEVRARTAAAESIGGIALPGSFFAAGESTRYLLPFAQGVLWDGAGKPFEKSCLDGRHTGFTMGMTGAFSESGGVLTTFETRDDMVLWVGRREGGRHGCTPRQIESLGSMRYDRVVRLRLTDPGIVPIAKAYRKTVQAKGVFRSWEEKIAERPGLERLFGSLMCFIGYCRDDLDYVAECRKLRDYGFDRALVYPGAFRTFNGDFRMGGERPVRLDKDTVRGIRALGFDLSPWSWISEVRTDGEGWDERFEDLLRVGPDGLRVKGWEMDGQHWNRCCSARMTLREAETWETGDCAGIGGGISWQHFDVLASEGAGECYATDHAGHEGRALSRGESREWIRKIFGAARARGHAVSSESFNDAFAPECDFGSAKLWPLCGEASYWPVPLTGLVYHDSIIHSWWEVHNYNNSRHVCFHGPHFRYGGGQPRLMAALDALMGCPPDVFPFGAQYAWTGEGPNTVLYKFRFDEPEVQIALREALPVARLHRRIGKLEMVHFDILSEDGYVQEAAFADGTRIVANFAGQLRSGFGGVGALRGESWMVAE